MTFETRLIIFASTLALAILGTWPWTSDRYVQLAERANDQAAGARAPVQATRHSWPLATPPAPLSARATTPAIQSARAVLVQLEARLDALDSQLNALDPQEDAIRDGLNRLADLADASSAAGPTSIDATAPPPTETTGVSEGARTTTLIELNDRLRAHGATVLELRNLLAQQQAWGFVSDALVETQSRLAREAEALVGLQSEMARVAALPSQGRASQAGEVASVRTPSPAGADWAASATPVASPAPSARPLTAVLDELQLKRLAIREELVATQEAYRDQLARVAEIESSATAR